MGRKWSRESVLEAIRSWLDSGQGLGGIYRKDQNLYCAANRHFGSWISAVLAAGGKPSKRRWTRQTILEAILELHEQGTPIGRIAEDEALAAACRRHFGGLRVAIAEAGLEPGPWRMWTRQEVIAAIQAHYQQGLPLGRLSSTNRSLGRAGNILFGSWRRAVAPAGVPSGWHCKWTRQLVIEALQGYGRNGPPTCSKQRIPNDVRSAVFQFFDTWHEALVAAGLASADSCPRRRRKWTAAMIVAEIRRGSAPGAPMKVAEDPCLGMAARKHFGSWPKALLAAGIETPPWRKWSPERVLEAIRAWHDSGGKVNGDFLEHQRLTAAARARFGSWLGALVAAGIIGPDDCSKWGRKWNKQRIIQEIQDRHIRGVSLSADGRLTSAGKRHFVAACKAANSRSCR